MTMLATRALGEVEIDENQIITFTDGLFGFGEQTKFVLLEEPGDSPFFWLQSVEKSDLAFILIDPFLFSGDSYKPAIALPELDLLKIKDLNECKTFVIVTIPRSNPEEMTANLQGPVFINQVACIGRQAISLDDRHELRVSILEKVEG